MHISFYHELIIHYMDILCKQGWWTITVWLLDDFTYIRIIILIASAII